MAFHNALIVHLIYVRRNSEFQSTQISALTLSLPFSSREDLCVVITPTDISLFETATIIIVFVFGTAY